MDAFIFGLGFDIPLTLPFIHISDWCRHFSLEFSLSWSLVIFFKNHCIVGFLWRIKRIWYIYTISMSWLEGQLTTHKVSSSEDSFQWSIHSDEVQHKQKKSLKILVHSLWWQKKKPQTEITMERKKDSDLSALQLPFYCKNDFYLLTYILLLLIFKE